jgi:hypothetical membrane protein
MFRAAYRSSSGALTVFAASGLHIHVMTARCHVWVGIRGCKYSLELLIMSGMPLETCWAFNERWNNKFYYKVVSCWLFLLSHTAMHGSMNIKFINAKQATEIHAYKNTKRKLYKTKAAIWFNKTCRDKQLTTNYINIKINGRLPHAYVNHRPQIQLELLMMSGVPLETCWAFNERWNNKFYYKVAFCWLFLLIHTSMHESRNIKSKYLSFPSI